MRALTSLGAYLAALAGSVLLTSSGGGRPAGADENARPPWGGASESPVDYAGVRLAVPGVTDIVDLHGNPLDASLVLYVGGNYFFALPPLLHAFTARHPELAGSVYYETLPPGILRRQMEMRNTITVGNLTLAVAPDVFQAGERQLGEMVAAGLLDEPIVPFTATTLAIMVPVGNPGRVESLSDLARPGLRLAMPNPETEGIAAMAKDALRRAGGIGLEREVYEVKVQRGEVFLTEVHHRQTPALLIRGEAQAGITWATEVNNQERSGAPIAGVPIAQEFNARVTFAAAPVARAPHAEAAGQWLRFLVSPEAQAILSGYGFEPVAGSGRPEAVTEAVGSAPYFAAVADDVELSQPAEGSVKLLCHYDYLDPARFAASLRTVANLLRYYGEAARPVKVAMVFHHHGVNFLMKGYRRGSVSQPFAARDGYTNHAFFGDELRRLERAGVAIRVCRNTILSLGLERGDLWPFAKPIAGGAVWVGELQSSYGYAYIKADE